MRRMRSVCVPATSNSHAALMQSYTMCAECWESTQRRHVTSRSIARNAIGYETSILFLSTLLSRISTVIRELWAVFDCQKAVRVERRRRDNWGAEGASAPRGGGEAWEGTLPSHGPSSHAVGRGCPPPHRRGPGRVYASLQTFNIFFLFQNSAFWYIFVY